jgi:hypothetical protein
MILTYIFTKILYLIVRIVGDVPSIILTILFPSIARVYGYIPRSELTRIYRISYNGFMYDYFYSEYILITIDSPVRSFMLTRKGLPDWETLYKTQKVETMPWYNENFDSDLKELDERKIINVGGQKFPRLWYWSRYADYVAC